MATLEWLISADGTSVRAQLRKSTDGEMQRRLWLSGPLGANEITLSAEDNALIVGRTVHTEKTLKAKVAAGGVFHGGSLLTRIGDWALLETLTPVR